VTRKGLVTIERDGNNKYARPTDKGRAPAEKPHRRRRIAGVRIRRLFRQRRADFV
jgi:hypothetical protein